MYCTDLSIYSEILCVRVTLKCFVALSSSAVLLYGKYASFKSFTVKHNSSFRIVQCVFLCRNVCVWSTVLWNLIHCDEMTEKAAEQRF